MRYTAERDAYLAEFTAAVGGDMSATWEQARHALDARGGE